MKWRDKRRQNQRPLIVTYINRCQACGKRFPAPRKQDFCSPECLGAAVQKRLEEAINGER